MQIVVVVVVDDVVLDPVVVEVVKDDIDVLMLEVLVVVLVVSVVVMGDVIVVDDFDVVVDVAVVDVIVAVPIRRGVCDVTETMKELPALSKPALTIWFISSVDSAASLDWAAMGSATAVGVELGTLIVY
mmetsp:Transcript_14786/g.51837  ORF Transcript_14786/g.51837 Transcript_14786/m.51837 type:complete len:129 (-) Transcript_14786:441-827(-)